jgi:DNA/RNA endonuclease YhcR with UshA esterase domain
LDDGTGEIALILWSDVLSEIVNRVDLDSGVWLDVQGVVAEYRGELEVIPDLASDVRVLAADSHDSSAAALSARATVPATALPAGAMPSPVPDVTRLPGATRRAASTPGSVSAATLTVTPAPTALRTALTVAPTPELPVVLSTGLVTAGHLGQRVALLGRIVDATQFASGVRSIVDDDSGSVVVWMPQVVYEGLADRRGWRVGSQVRVVGRVDQYKDEIEVVPRSASHVVVVHAVLPDSERVVVIAELGAASVGRHVTVEAQVAVVEPFSEGVKLTIDDGSGQVTLLLWQNVYEAVPDRAQLAAGATIRALGKVQEYRGMLEIVPGLGMDVIVTR